MLRLNTFGGLVLQQDGQLHTGPASQRRRLALLAVAAAAGRRGVSRDKLLAPLWPDSEPEAARHSLYQAVHAIRRSAGSDEIFLGSTTLQLNPQVITSGVGEFGEAVESGAHEQAVRLYRGPFLDGFRLESAPDYEQWQDGERVRHAREYAAALEALAAGAAARGDHPAAVRWWRRLAAADPVSTTAAVGLIEALVAAGDRAGRAPVRRGAQHAGAPASRDRSRPRDRDLDRAAPLRRRSGGRAASPAVATGLGPDMAREAAERELEEIRRAFADRYQVGDRTGESTLLLTFAARDRRDTRQVELHVLGALERVAALRDPRILPVREAGAMQGRIYFATPPLERQSLRDRLARERQLPVADARRIALELLDALVYAHGHDVRHGDLRPKHILLGRNGVTVASFGLVEALDLAEAGNAGSTAVERRLRPRPDDAKMLAMLALAHMHLRRHADATRAGERAAELLPLEPARDGSTRPPGCSSGWRAPAPGSRRPRSGPIRSGIRCGAIRGSGSSRSTSRHPARHSWTGFHAAPMFPPMSPAYTRIYAVVRRIPEGRVATYGQVAELAGIPGRARQVGYALHALPGTTAVPWHRVLNARGALSLRRSAGQIAQRMLLEREGVRFDAGGRVALERVRWRPSR